MKEIVLREIALKYGFIEGLSVYSSTNQIKEAFYDCMKEVANQCFDLAAESCIPEEDLEGNDLGCMIGRSEILKLKDQIK